MSEENQKLRIINHGAAIRGRKIEIIVEAVGQMNNIELNLILVSNDKAYYATLLDLAKKFNNINFISTLPYHQIVTFISQYDIGLYILNASIFNNNLTLPNKIFEFIQAMLALVVSPNDEIAAIVNNRQIGAVTNGYKAQDLKVVLEQLTINKINSYKTSIHQVVQQLSAEVYYDKMKEVIRAF